MNVFNYFRDEIRAIVKDIFPGVPLEAVACEPPRDPAHGDLATSAALALAKPVGRKPREVAEAIAARLRAHHDIESVEVAGPGFINLRLPAAYWQARIRDILTAGPAYGDSAMGDGQKINVEYVSANPTGPMHVGHCRGAVVGDALAALLAKAGYEVTREYYINDAGGQIGILAHSVYFRYLEALGDQIPSDIFAGYYPGEYLKPVGEALAREHGATLKGRDPERWLPVLRDFAVKAMMGLIRDDLAALGIAFDVYASEAALHRAGKVEESLQSLERKDLIYTGILEPPKGKLPEDWEPRPQLLFKSSGFGDDIDRPLKKSDGSWTYFAGDVAYHADKLDRGFRRMIDVWGADHGGYVKRMKAAVKALSGGHGSLEVKLCQMVNLLDGGEPVKMSKRSGSFVTLREVVEEVGKDVVRFIMLTRRNDAQLDFDYVKVREQSKDNPVFYVQYAHARCRSVLRQAGYSPTALMAAAHGRLTAPEELALLRLLACWPRTIESAAEAGEPHRVAFYLYDLAAAFHGLWNRGNEDPSLRFIIASDSALTAARVALVQAVAHVIASGLAVMGVTPVEEMR
ncbi:MAG: arginine--tRNA ligase [Alphaproteobacteria bacterium]|nr:arginine--tRNA ligase [Alphaproteobacteria bacterium]